MTPSRILATCLSGLLMALAFPHWDLWVAAWVGLIPFLWALRDRAPREAALLGMAGGTVHYVIVLYWLVGTMRLYGSLPLPLALGFLVLLVLYMASYWALFGALLVFIRRALGVGLLWVAPALWCGLEGLRSVLLSGFPWALLGYSQWSVTPLVQVADITGVYGLSFLLVWANAALLDLAEAWREGASGRRWRALVGAGMAGILALGALLYGGWRIPGVIAASESAPRVPVGIAQGNIEQSLKWNPEKQEATFRIYAEQTRELARRGARLVVWPETAIPFFFQAEQGWRERLLELARETRVEVLFGAPAFAQEGPRQTFLNRAYLIGPGKGVLGWYDKVHLVPFGEYVPLQRLLPFIRTLVASIGDFSSGDGFHVLPSAAGAPVGVMICFESIFPEISRSFALNGAQILANITNDAWFGMTAAPYQHLSMLTLRAVESRRWIVRSANTGISAVVDPLGRLVVQSPLFQPAILIDEIPALQVKSWYMLHGDRFVQACSLWGAGLFILSLLSSTRGRRRRHGLA